MLLEKAEWELQDEGQTAAVEAFRQQAKLVREQSTKLRDNVLSSKQYSGDSLLEEVKKNNE